MRPNGTRPGDRPGPGSVDAGNAQQGPRLKLTPYPHLAGWPKKSGLERMFESAGEARVPCAPQQAPLPAPLPTEEVQVPGQPIIVTCGMCGQPFEANPVGERPFALGVPRHRMLGPRGEPPTARSTAADRAYLPRCSSLGSAGKPAGVASSTKRPARLCWTGQRCRSPEGRAARTRGCPCPSTHLTAGGRRPKRSEPRTLKRRRIVDRLRGSSEAVTDEALRRYGGNTASALTDQ